MKLKEGFIAHRSQGENMLVPTGSVKFSGLVRGNDTAGFIFDCLKTDTTEAEIISKMRSQYDAPEGTIERDVKKVLSELRKIGAINE